MSYLAFMDKLSRFDSKGNEAYDDFRDVCKEYVEDRLGEISENQYSVLFEYAWDQGHATGYQFVGCILDNLLDIITKFTGESS